MATSNKERNARIVTFKEDYFSKAGAAEKANPIYKKGTKHAMHATLAAQLQAKGAKIDVAKYDPDPAVRRLKAQRADNLKKATKAK